MTALFRKPENQPLVENLTVAKTFRTRAQGLIGTKIFPANKGMWFPKSNWIHTCFMSIPIDVIYLDKKMMVQKLQPSLKPWRFPAPVFKAHSVLEVPEGFIAKNNVQLGETFYVGD